MRAQSKNEVWADAIQVKERLRQWRLSLSDQQIDALYRQGSLTFPVSRPFEGLKKLVALDLPVTLTVGVNAGESAPVRDTQKIIIKDVTTDYGPWEQANAYLKLDRQDAQEQYERERAIYDQATENVRNALTAFLEATRLMNEKRIQFREAEQAAKFRRVDSRKAVNALRTFCVAWS